ncbi:hypothetical protein MRB53_038830 [Persea americana]|nr:hypothetical protein MRB53_038830 [Persea americana]
MLDANTEHTLHSSRMHSIDSHASLISLEEQSHSGPDRPKASSPLLDLEQAQRTAQWPALLAAMAGIFFLMVLLQIPLMGCPTSGLCSAVTLTVLDSEKSELSIAAKSFMNASISSHWHGWTRVEDLIVFGDSWSDTGFDISGKQPSIENPLGNPEWPGDTASKQANWVDRLTVEFNQSNIMTYNFAASGGYIDPSGDNSTRLMMQQQVADFNDLKGKWKTESSLFAIWFGINDVLHQNEFTDNLEEEFVELSRLVELLRAHGARNFLFFTNPFETVPLAISAPSSIWSDRTKEWNTRLSILVDSLIEEDTTTFLFDVRSLFLSALNTPCLYDEACKMQELKNFCSPYSFGTPTPDFKAPECEWAVDKYMWLNSFHPSSAAHNFTAHMLSQALMQYA